MKKIKDIPEYVEIPKYNGKYFVRYDGSVFKKGRSKPLSVYKVHSTYCVKLNDGKRRKDVSLNKIMKECYFRGEKGHIIHNMEESNFNYWTIECGKADFGRQCMRSVVRIKDGTVEFYKSETECAKKNFISLSHLTNILNGRRSQNKDEIYMFESDYYKECEDDYFYNETCV